MPSAIFPVPAQSFAGGPEFRAFLADALEAGPGEPLTIIVGVTKHSRGELVGALEAKGFHVERRLGQVLHLAYEDGEDKLETYLTFEGTGGVIIFYTNYRKTEDVPFLTKKFLEVDPMSRPLSLRPIVVQRVLDELSREHEGLQVTEFTARRYPGSKVRAQIRPGIDRRTFQYWGIDGRQVLQELQYNYGVSPNRITIDIPEAGKFGIDGRGFLTYMRGNLGLVLGILGQVIDEAQRATKAFDGTSFEVFPLKTANKTFKIPSSTGAIVQLRRSLPYSEMDDVKAALDEKFAVLDFTAEEGSLFLSTDVVSKSGHRFRIKASENQMKMLPDGETNFAAFMEFYSFVIDSIDPEAELIV